VLTQAKHGDTVTAGLITARTGPPAEPCFFTEAERACAAALLNQLTGQCGEPLEVPLAEMVDARLAAGETDGWHYADMPEDGQAWRDTLGYLDKDAHARCGTVFADASREDQAAIIQAVQDGREWHGLSAARVWSLWTRYACTAMYSHPHACLSYRRVRGDCTGLRGVSWPAEAGNFSCWVETSPGRSDSRAGAMARTSPVTCARDGYTVVALHGELDVYTAADSVRTLTAHAAAGARIVVNLAELTFIDCGSLRAVVSVRAQARQAGGDLALADPQAIVLRLLLFTGVISRCPVFASVHDAVKGGPAALLSP